MMERAAEVLHSVASIKPPKGLVTKLAEVMGQLKRIPKNGHNSFHNYDYVLEADLLDAVRSALAERQIFIFPDVVDVKRMPHEIETMKGLRKTQLTEIMVRWTFCDGETGEIREVHMPGVGEDASDKGLYKSLTGSEKYLIMKTFLVSSGDDPERESPTDSYDAREKQQKVAEEKLRKKKQDTALKAPDDVLVITPWGADGKWVSLSGGGITILRSEMPPEEAKRFGLKKQPDDTRYAIMPAANIADLEEFCLRVSVKPRRMGAKVEEQKEGTFEADV